MQLEFRGCLLVFLRGRVSCREVNEQVEERESWKVSGRIENFCLI